MSKESVKNQIHQAWVKVLLQPPLWAFSKDEPPALWDQSTHTGISFDPKEQTWAIGHITENEIFVPSAGPFLSIEGATTCLIGFVANVRAARVF